MFKHITFISLFFYLTIASAASNHEVGIEFQQRNDIDYQTDTTGLSVSAIIPVGLFACDHAETSGETRIDSFNNIFGVSSVLNNPWLDYDATKTACKYGLKLPLAGGTLKAGVGYTVFEGSTELVAGGKDIEVTGKGLDVTYSKQQQRWRIKYTQQHIDIFARLASYDNPYDIKENTTRLSYSNGSLDVIVEDVDGERKDTFSTTLFPTNEFDYRYQTLETGKTFSLADKRSWYLAPIFISGSQRGTFNPLETDSAFYGLQLKYNTASAAYSFKVTDFSGDGGRLYLPGNDPLHEYKDMTHYQFSYERDKWQLSVKNINSKYLGRISAINGVYPALVGGAGIYNNSREEDSWQLDAHYQLTESTSVSLNLVERTIKDTQYSYAVHQYDEDSIGIKLNQAF